MAKIYNSGSSASIIIFVDNNLAVSSFARGQVRAGEAGGNLQLYDLSSGIEPRTFFNGAASTLTNFGGTSYGATPSDVINNASFADVIGTNSGGGGASGVPNTRQINTNSPLRGGGDLSADRTLELTTIGVTTQTPLATDLILFESGGVWRKNTLQNVLNAFKEVVFLDETSTPLDLVDGKTHIYIGNADLNWDFDAAFPSGIGGANPFPIGFNIYNLSQYIVNVNADGGQSGFGILRLGFLSEVTTFDTGSGIGFWGVQYQNQYPYFPDINSLLQITNSINNNSVFWQSLNRTLEVSSQFLQFRKAIIEIILGVPTVTSNDYTRYDADVIEFRNSSTGRFRINKPNISLIPPSTDIDVNFRHNVGGIVAFLSDSIANILQGGNSFGANITIGSNDNFALQFETNAITRATISNVGVFNIANLTSLGNRLIQANSGGDLQLTSIDPADISLLSTLTENVQDIIGAFVAGTASNISTVYNDAANTFVIDLISTAVVANAYGSATQIPTFTVDAKGRLILATNLAIAIPSTQVTDFVEASQDAVGAALLDTNSIDFTYNDVANTITADIKVSPNAGNGFSILANGAYVSNTSDGTQIITAANTTTNVNLALINSGKFEIDMSALTANTSIVVTNPVNGRDYSFLFRGNSNRNVTFPASFVWDDGLAFDGFSSSSPSNKVIFTYYASILQFIVKK